MIFVTVATHFLGFERLIKEIDKIASKIDEQVIAQIGSTKYIPRNMQYFTYIDEEKLEELYENSRIIITHAGAGTILKILKYKKPMIIVPRMKKFNEHVDDHQLELADALRNQNNAIVVYEIGDLEEALKKIDTINYIKIDQNKTLVSFLKGYIEKMKI